MIYLISQLWVWLLLTLVFAGLAGWAFAAERSAPEQRAHRRERENLLSDILRIANEDVRGGDPAADEREIDGARRALQLRDGRIAELERSLEHARARADDLAGELAEAQRRGPLGGEDSAELTRLRALVADYEAEQARTIDVETTPVEEPPAVVDSSAAESEAALQTWRLRYFEQRVRYLEARAPAPLDEPPQASAALTPLADWRAREASARADYLESALRAHAPLEPSADASEENEAFAANAEVDTLLRWRLLYLERRVAHLQSRPAPAEAVPEPVAATAPAGPDPDRWKWRAHYLEARVRHLEQRTVATAPSAPQRLAAEAPPAPEPAPAAPPRRRGAKPPVLSAARNGAPDDFTLIDGVSLLQQGTLNALGVFHFDQIAAWSPDHVAWVDAYLRLQGRIDDESWVEQAQALAEHGPSASSRLIGEEVD